MNTSIFIKSLKEVDKGEFDYVYTILNKNQKTKVDKEPHKIVEYYLLDDYIRKNNLNYNIRDIKYSSNGKPTLGNLHFNISNKDDITVLGISTYEIGIDIERVTNYDKNVLKLFFTEREAKNINTNYDFFKIYTLKEAYIKMKDLTLLEIKSDEYNDYYNATLSYNKYVISYVINKK